MRSGLRETLAHLLLILCGCFKKGQSGNSKGRPKSSKNAEPAWNEERLKDIVLQEAYRTITVQDGDRNVTVPMAQAVVLALAVNAARGQHRSQRLFAEILSATERQNKAHHDEWLETAIGYKIDLIGAVRSLELSSLGQISLLTGKIQGKYAFFTRFEEFGL